MTGESGQTRDPGGTLEDGELALQPTAVAANPSELAGVRGMKFTFTSGSRPLDGYTIKRGVGIGGFGEVYFAKTDAGKEVALKCIQRNLDVEVRGVTQCLNLKHINLIGLYDIKYDDQGEAWVVMEYVSGRSLREAIDDEPDGMPLKDALDWFKGIAAGVQYLHDHGIVHRDLKPGNIFSDEGVVKIGDYGLSKFISCSRRSGQTESVGTFHYMAPEIGKGVYGKEIDIYALGIILYELLTGRIPFDGESSQEIIMKHLTAEPDLQGVNEPFLNIIRKCLFKDPEKRYRSVEELMAAIDTPDDTPVPPADSDIHMIADTPPRAEEAQSAIVIDDEPKADEPIYISDDEPDEMVFGPVKQQQPTRRPPPEPRVPPRGPQRSQSVSMRPPATAAAGYGSASAINVQPLASRPREPIAGAVHDSWGSFSNWWNHSGISAPLKVILVIAFCFFVFLNAAWLLPVMVVLGAVYLVYYGIRSLLMATTATQPQRRRQVSPRGTPAIDEEGLTQLCRDGLRRKGFSERSSELTGAMLFSGIVCGITSFVMMMFADESIRGIALEPNQFAWVTSTAIAGVWIMLVLGKFWETSSGESIRRRFAMLVAGLLVGGFAMGAAEFLQVSLPSHRDFVPEYAAGVGIIHTASGLPEVPAFLLYFAGLFVILRWWRLTDPLRRSRFSIFATVLAVVWAWLIPFAQPWGMLVAATIAISVQLSSPWHNRAQRVEIRRQTLQA